MSSSRRAALAALGEAAAGATGARTHAHKKKHTYTIQFSENILLSACSREFIELQIQILLGYVISQHHKCL